MGTWKKEEELKQLKSEVAALERKIQLTLAAPEQPAQVPDSPTEQKADMVVIPQNLQVHKDSKGFRI